MSDQTANEKQGILVVDDVAVVLNTVTSILKEKYNVYGLPRGEMVPKLLKTKKIDLFILDIEMPGMDGYALFHLIREIPEHKETPIMFFTSHENMAENIKEKGLAAAGCIEKPVESRSLLEKVAAVLA